MSRRTGRLLSILFCFIVMVLSSRYLQYPRKVFRYVMNKLGYELVPLSIKSVSHIKGVYISAEETISTASKLGLSVCEYVESVWNQKGGTQFIVDSINAYFDLKKVKNVLEIGAGTGRYLEKILAIVHPDTYESYEVAEDWARWLAKTYHITSHNADGKTLNMTKDNSIDFLHAHGVFVFLPFLVTISYFQEIARVVKSGGYVVFDIYAEDCFDDDILKKWLSSKHSYPCFLSTDYTVGFFGSHGFELRGSFHNPKHGQGKSKYLIFQKM